MPKTRKIMMENTQLICLDLEYLIEKKMVKNICQTLFDMLAKKGLHYHDPKQNLKYIKTRYFSVMMKGNMIFQLN